MLSPIERISDEQRRDHRRVRSCPSARNAAEFASARAGDSVSRRYLFQPGHVCRCGEPGHDGNGMARAHHHPDRRRLRLWVRPVRQVDVVRKGDPNPHALASATPQARRKSSRSQPTPVKRGQLSSPSAVDGHDNLKATVVGACFFSRTPRSLGKRDNLPQNSPSVIDVEGTIPGQPFLDAGPQNPAAAFPHNR